jgi:hypothetical protein
LIFPWSRSIASPPRAKSTAAALERNSKYVEAVAFRRTGDPDTGDFGDAEIIGRYGNTPNDLQAL